jgi:hypothetical protein
VPTGYAKCVRYKLQRLARCLLSIQVVMIRILLACSAAVFLGSIAAFLLFVSMLSIAAVGLILLGLMLMFGLGVQVGTRVMGPWESHAMSIVADASSAADLDQTRSHDHMRLIARP